MQSDLHDLGARTLHRMIDGIGAVKPDDHIFVEWGVFIYIVRILCAPFPAPSPAGDRQRIALLTRVARILVLPPAMSG